MPSNDNIFLEKGTYAAASETLTFTATNAPDEWQVRLINDDGANAAVFDIATVDEDGDEIQIDGGLETVAASSSSEIIISTRNPSLKISTDATSTSTDAIAKVKAYSTNPQVQEVTGTLKGSFNSVTTGGYGAAKVAS